MPNLLATLDTLLRELEASEVAAEMMHYLSWRPVFVEAWITLYPPDDKPDTLLVRIGWAEEGGRCFCLETPLTATVRMAAA